jgi:hypothetical protein
MYLSRELKYLFMLERSVYVLFTKVYIECKSLFHNFNYCQTCSYLQVILDVQLNLVFVRL